MNLVIKIEISVLLLLSILYVQDVVYYRVFRYWLGL